MLRTLGTTPGPLPCWTHFFEEWPMGRGEQATGEAASRLIDQRIRDLGGWRGETLARVRALILDAVAFRALVQAAVAQNEARARRR